MKEKPILVFVDEPESLTMYSYISNGLCFEYFVGYEITTLLGYKNPSKTIKDNVSKCNQLLFRDYPGVKQPPLDPRTILITRDGAIEILLKTRKLLSPSIDLIFKEFGIKTTNKKCLSKEQQTLSDISKIFKTEEVIPQFPVGTYRIDLVFPKYKIFIECDEYGHSDRHPEKEQEREDFINHEMQTTKDNWVRFNPDDQKFDIASVIGKIYMKISMFKDEATNVKRCCTCRKEKKVYDDNNTV